MLKKFIKSHRNSILTIQICYVKQETMCKKTFRAIITILILPSLFIGTVTFSSLALANLCPENSYPNASLQKTCDMDHCNPNLPKCPLCPSSISVNPFLLQETDAYLPTPTASFIPASNDTLSDQEVVKSIFHPPATIL